MLPGLREQQSKRDRGNKQYIMTLCACVCVCECAHACVHVWRRYKCILKHLQLNECDSSVSAGLFFYFLFQID